MHLGGDVPNARSKPAKLISHPCALVVKKAAGEPSHPGNPESLTVFCLHADRKSQMRQQGKRKRKAKEGALVGLFSLNFAIYFLKSEKYICCHRSET